jgi:hypothetical protein
MLKIKLPKVLPPIEDHMGRRNISVLRLGCGDKFLITKSANPEWMVKEIVTTYNKYLKKDSGIYETNLFFPLLKYSYTHEFPIIVVEVLFTSTDGYQVLKFELEQLIQHFGTKDCLNANNIPHIPKTVLAAKGSNWLTQNQALNFRKLLTKYNY